MTEYYGFGDDMFSESQKISFHTFKTGEHRFRVLPPFAPNKLYHQVDLHWGYSDVDGRKKAILCTKYSHKYCPMCDEADHLKNEIEMLEKNPNGFSSREEFEILLGEKQKRLGEIKKKPTYLWNIINDEGQTKVLQLSWNGHEPLYTKVKFLWDTQKINITDPNNSQLMWVNRSGTGVKTRYVYEMMQGGSKKLENLGAIIDLSKVYTFRQPAELKRIVELGYVPKDNEDPNARDFTAEAPKAEAAPVVKTQTAPSNVPVENVKQMPAQQPLQQQVYQETQAKAIAPELPNVDDEIAEMQRILNNG